jgi:hypothetical protein
MGTLFQSRALTVAVKAEFEHAATLNLKFQQE